MNVYLHRNGQRLGPYPLASLQEMARQGHAQATDLVWQEGAAQWEPLPSFLAARAGGPPSLPPVAPPPMPAPPVVDEIIGPIPGVDGVTGLTVSELREELQRGGRFVFYQY